ncbi:MAG: hypothetical protein LUI15_02985 [Firmicutes bacterium]|nr:hypothetical protein [Bacillota bacterium]
MIKLENENGQRYVYDEGSGTKTPITALEYKMLGYIKPPMPKDLPAYLRYDLAKYDSGSVEEAYERLYQLYADGKLFS